MLASWPGSVGAGTKEDESSTGGVWAAGFHHFMAHSCLARILKFMNLYFFNFPNFFWSTVNHGYGGPPVYGYFLCHISTYVI